MRYVDGAGGADRSTHGLTYSCSKDQVGNHNIVQLIAVVAKYQMSLTVLSVMMRVALPRVAQAGCGDDRHVMLADPASPRRETQSACCVECVLDGSPILCPCATWPPGNLAPARPLRWRAVGEDWVKALVTHCAGKIRRL